MASSVFIIVVTITILGLLIYMIYKKYNTSKYQEKIIGDILNGDTLFNQTLSPDQIRSLHKLVTSI